VNRTGRPQAVITGLGSVSSLGFDTEKAFATLCAGDSELRTPPDGHPVASLLDVASIAPDVEAAQVLSPPVDACVDRYVVLALKAAEFAMADAELDIGVNADPMRVALVAATGGGALGTYEEGAIARLEHGRAGVSPYLAPGMLPNMSAARLAIKYGIRGYSTVVTTACAAGGQVVAEALRLIRDDQADVVVCAASEAALRTTAAAAFVNANALAHGFDDPRDACRPFDRRRNGFVMGEGGAMLIIERVDHADARGVGGYADVIGWGATTDGFHLTAPRPDASGASECMRRALADAEVAPGDVAYINAHATGTRRGDLAEAKAIRAVYGDDGPAVSATKSMTGHLLGASGALEAIVTTLAIARGQLPPTRNLDDVDRGCELDHIRGPARLGPVPVAMSNSFGFGGHNISLVFGAATTQRTRASEGGDERVG
jgi:3-oxoacyl-[acyl-carrier-protein] synthase II